MNILMVADVSIAPVSGGAERALFEYSTRLAERGHTVHILTRRYPYHSTDQEMVGKVREWRFAFDDRTFFTALHSTIIKSNQLFAALTETVPFDVINFHQPFSALGVAGSNKSRNIRKIYTCHSLSFEEFLSRTPRPAGLPWKLLYYLNTKLRWFLERRVLKQSDEIMVLSQFTRAKLIEHYGIPKRKIHIIPGGVDLSRFNPGTDTITIRRKLQIPDDKIVLFTVRNLVSRMGLENLLQAMSKVALQYPQIFLVIGGKGPLREKLVGLTEKYGIQDKVCFAGFIDEKELPQYYQMADLFVLPTKELEGFGLVTTEALASGLPVLGTPVGGTIEILSKLGSEFLFKDTSVAAIAAGICRMAGLFIQQPAKRELLGQECRKFAERYYSWNDKIKQLEKLFAG